MDIDIRFPENLYGFPDILWCLSFVHFFQALRIDGFEPHLNCPASIPAHFFYQCRISSKFGSHLAGPSQIQFLFLESIQDLMRSFLLDYEMIVYKKEPVMIVRFYFFQDPFHTLYPVALAKHGSN